MSKTGRSVSATEPTRNERRTQTLYPCSVTSPTPYGNENKLVVVCSPDAMPSMYILYWGFGKK
jgi:hypothetical protein